MFKLTTCLAALILSLSLYSQDNRFSVGIQAGPMFATVNPHPEVLEAGFRTGFFAGANARWAFTDSWTVQGNMQFSQRGFNYITRGTWIILDGQAASFTGQVDYRISYLDVVPQIEFKPIRYIGIAAGPYFSWQLGESIRYGEVIDWTSTKENNQFDTADLGLAGKLSGNIGRLTVFVSYMHGLTNISKIIIIDGTGTHLGRLSAYNRAIAAGAGFNF